MEPLAIGFGAAMIIPPLAIALSVGTRRKPSPLGTTNESLLLFAPGGLGGGAGFCRCLGGGPGGGAGFCSFLGGGPGGGAGPSSFGAALVEELGSGAALVSFGGTNNCFNCAALACLVASKISLIFLVSCGGLSS